MGADKASPADLIFLKKFSKGNTNVIVKYLVIFLRTNPPLLDTIEKQMRKQEWALVENSAHALKTQFNFVGFGEGEVLVRKIRNHVEEKAGIDQLSEALLQLRQLCDELYEQLKREIVRLK